MTSGARASLLPLFLFENAGPTSALIVSHMRHRHCSIDLMSNCRNIDVITKPYVLNMIKYSKQQTYKVTYILQPL